MKKILVTGARAPAALEIIRRLAKEGYEAYAADCLYFPPGRFSRYTSGYLRYPSPRHDLRKFIARLIAFVEQHKIDLIFPTCEEAFYLSACKAELEKYCKVFCEDFATMAALHNKMVFQDIAGKNGMGSIVTTAIEHPQQIDIIEKLTWEKNYVLKPVFSRFGNQVVLNLKPTELSKYLNPDLFPWAVQEYIKGQEYCTYALCRQGKIVAQACYKPTFRAGQGSSVYFQPVLHDEIFRQVGALVAGLNYSGQIGFDFIMQDDGRVFVLECNPRTTSGVHLLSEKIDWKTLFLTDATAEPIVPTESPMRSKMVSLAMLIYSWRSPNRASFQELWTAFCAADDVVGGHSDWGPFAGQIITISEILWRSFSGKQSLKNASIADIKWDGQEIGR